MQSKNGIMRCKIWFAGEKPQICEIYIRPDPSNPAASRFYAYFAHSDLGSLVSRQYGSTEYEAYQKLVIEARVVEPFLLIEGL